MAGILVAIAVAAPLSAWADHPLGNIPWPNLLPPRPVSAPASPLEPCLPAEPSCVDGVIRQMIKAWTPLDDACDHRAVFALTYLITTQGFREYLSDRREPRFFADEAGIIQLDRAFANLYFDAVTRYGNGAAPPAWRIAFDAARDGRTNAVQDIFLGMNAHIQRDLPVILAGVGLVQADGSTRKSDHDAVNEILSGVLDHIEDEIGRLYDPMVTLADASPSPVDEMGALELLKSWREGAWRNAERLTLATSDAERKVIMTQIETYALIWAQLIAAPDFRWYQARRSAYCTAAHQATQP